MEQQQQQQQQEEEDDVDEFRETAKLLDVGGKDDDMSWLSCETASLVSAYEVIYTI